MTGPLKFILSASMVMGLLSCNAKPDVGENQSEKKDITHVDMDYLCGEQSGLSAFCGFQQPEDMEWLPDGSGMIVSQYGTAGAKEGSLVQLNHKTGEISPLYAGKGSAQGASSQWGEEGCEEQTFFSPHGISFHQLPNGRLQLLVVNHGSNEVIDFFEVRQFDDNWGVEWRGCVAAPDDSLLNDVAATKDGFYTTRFYAKGDPYNAIRDYQSQSKNGHVKRWSKDKGWRIVEGTQAVLPNGVLWNAADDELVVAHWGSHKVVIYSGEGTKKRSLEMFFPDNISWNEDRTRYLVPAKLNGEIEKAVQCSIDEAELCELPFHINEFSPGQADFDRRFAHDGSFYGLPSNAIERDGKLYIGSFWGSRILVAE